jgi:hypothetical protein
MAKQEGKKPPKPKRLNRAAAANRVVAEHRGKSTLSDVLTVAQRTEVHGIIVDTRLQPHRDKSSDTSNV